MGKALKDYLAGDKEAKILVKSREVEDEELPVEHFFRTFENLNNLEKKALDLCYGKTLDIGAGSGCHSLILQERGMKVEALEISSLAIEVMKDRGVKKIHQENIFEFTQKGYDTLLLLMNGIGLVGDLKGLDTFLKHTKTLLNKKGQILLDSSDIQFLFQEEDGSVWIDLSTEYYGEITYQMEYGGVEGEWFKWLFVDFDTLSEYAKKNKLSCELIEEDDHFGFVARLGV